jgi:FKBP-type peptidyl-prolyl cis-trans isomerase
MTTTKLILAAIAALALCGCAADNPTTATTAATREAPPAKAACAPPPTELVKKDLDAGSGDAARFRSAVIVSYTGWLYDGCKPGLKGEQFDTSVGRSTPFGLVLGAGRVIKGWDEGLIGMKEHGRRLLVIPPDKAYGERAVGPIIKPNSTLVFEVELLKILSQGDSEAAPAAK